MAAVALSEALHMNADWAANLKLALGRAPPPPPDARCSAVCAALCHLEPSRLIRELFGECASSALLKSLASTAREVASLRELASSVRSAPLTSIAALSRALLLLSPPDPAAAAILLANRSAHLLRAGFFDAALSDADCSVLLRPSAAKSWYRRAQALRAILGGASSAAVESTTSLERAAEAASDVALRLAQLDALPPGERAASLGAIMAARDVAIAALLSCRAAAAALAAADAAPFVVLGPSVDAEGVGWRASSRLGEGVIVLEERAAASLLLLPPLRARVESGGEEASGADSDAARESGVAASGAPLPPHSLARVALVGSRRCSRCLLPFPALGAAGEGGAAAEDCFYALSCPLCCHLDVDVAAAPQTSLPVSAVYCGLSCLCADRAAHALECEGNYAALPPAHAAARASAPVESRLAARLASEPPPAPPLPPLSTASLPRGDDRCSSIALVALALQAVALCHLLEAARRAAAAATAARCAGGGGAHPLALSSALPIPPISPPALLLALARVGCNAFAATSIIEVRRAPAVAGAAARAHAEAPPPLPACVLLEEVRVGLAVYRSASFFDHACAPNCVARFAGGAITVTTAGSVREGAPLCISYGARSARRADMRACLLPAFAQRRAALLASHAFLCRCALCCEEEAATQARAAAARAAAEPSPAATIAAARGAERSAAAAVLRSALAAATAAGAESDSAAAAALEAAASAVLACSRAETVVGEARADLALFSAASELARRRADARDWLAAAAWQEAALGAVGALLPSASSGSSRGDGSTSLCGAALQREPGLALEAFKLAQLRHNAGRRGPQEAALARAVAPLLRALLPLRDPLLEELRVFLAFYAGAAGGGESRATSAS